VNPHALTFPNRTSDSSSLFFLRSVPQFPGEAFFSGLEEAIDLAHQFQEFFGILLNCRTLTERHPSLSTLNFLVESRPQFGEEGFYLAGISRG
jgi:hypothetical protein